VWSFDMPGLAALLEPVPTGTLDGLDFAVIRVDGAGLVRALNRTAAALPWLQAEGAIGRSFYGEVAPSLANADLRARIERALKRGALDLELGHVSSLADPLHGMRGRMQPAKGGGFWLFLQPSG
jgi:hypothetical protein